MTKILGFLEPRLDPGYRPREERLTDFAPVECDLTEPELRAQAARCMECGTPFCHAFGCPLGNVIPELNELVYQGRWFDAVGLLLATNPFPEFTGRICPAPCEAACVAGLDGQPVSIRTMEKAVMDHAYRHGMLGLAPPVRHEAAVAVIGAGPAGLAVAELLNREGYRVTVYDEAEKPGGILRYGIPGFKLEKELVDRRIDCMRQAGVCFENRVRAGRDVSFHFLRERFQAIVLCHGARRPRDLEVPGRELAGIHFAMDFLMQQNRREDGIRIAPEEEIVATGKDVVVIGGGDTGSDCVGTSLRQKARSVLQLELLPCPPSERAEDNPWPEWPRILRTSSSHQEGGERRWSVSVKTCTGKDGHVRAIRGVQLKWHMDAARPFFEEKPDSEFEAPADLVLLAMGFLGPESDALADGLQLDRDAHGNIAVDENHQTNVPGVFAAGDVVGGPSLVVRAMADARSAVEGIKRWLQREADGAPRGMES